jgi:eukaryotic-like serine/threonine-protein kinase
VGSLGGQFYALDLATGKELWQAPAKLGVEGPACVAGDLVCFGDADGKVHGLDRHTGEARWVYETGDAVVGGLNVYRTRAGKLLLLVGSDDFFLHAIDAADGTRAWAVETANYIKGTPSLDPEGGVVIFGGCDELLRLIDAETGTLVREVPSVTSAKYVGK